MDAGVTQSIALIKMLHGKPAGKPGFKTYYTPTNLTCIGWGHPIGHPAIPLPISSERAGAILLKEVTAAKERVKGLISARLDHHHWAAVLCWAWSVKAGHAGAVDQTLEDSSLLRFINREEFVLASAEFYPWAYHRGKANKWMLGLREAERCLFCTGEMPKIHTN